jgi:hypothetical protein
MPHYLCASRVRRSTYCNRYIAPRLAASQRMEFFFFFFLKKKKRQLILVAKRDEARRPTDLIPWGGFHN